MSNINKPMDIPELNLKPPIDGKVRLSEDMQQTLALLSAYCENKRVILKASESGVLNVASAKIKDIVHFTRDGVDEELAGENVPCTECFCMGHPDNTGKVWVRPDKTATVDNAWPLAGGEVVGFTLDNLKQLNMFIAVDEETLIVAYTR